LNNAVARPAVTGAGIPALLRSQLEPFRSSRLPGPSVLRGVKEKDMNSKRKAIYLLLVFGSILLLVAGWNGPEDARESGR
jgi:hypothetical protein